jgi:hypothetical protein
MPGMPLQKTGGNVVIGKLAKGIFLFLSDICLRNNEHATACYEYDTHNRSKL